MAELKTVLDEKRKLVDKKATQYRTTRDEWNSRTKEHTVVRNELNAEVRELIQNVRQQREIREQMNELVREKKSTRSSASTTVKQAKSALDAQRGPKEEVQRDTGGRRDRRDKKPTIHSLRRDFERLDREFEMGRHTGKNEKKAMEKMKRIRSEMKVLQSAEDSNTPLKEARELLRAAMAAQEEAHLEVQKSAKAAQEAHELMLQWNKEVDNQREKAESAHRELRKSKKEADKAHHFYIVALRCLHSIQDMLRAMRGISSGDGQRGARVEVQDLMSKLMSGETLTTDELMQLQRYE